MAESYKKGQVIQIARGNLVSRLQAKPLAKGELFLHITEKHTFTQSESKVLDLVSDKNLKTIFKGDLFAGANSSQKVYYIGSGGSLKWGGISYATTWADAQQAAKDSPNFIYMYCGNGAIYKNEQSAEEQPAKLANDTHSYIASNSDEWLEEINPGDLFFYSPTLDHLVVINLGKSSDALTKINVSQLVSDSMQNWLADQFSDTDSAKAATTLKDFLDGPVRHYQYLIDNEGWNRVKVTKECVVDRNTETGVITVTKGNIDLNEDGDGFVHYVPFSTTNPGQNQYTTTLNGIPTTTVIREGDLILSIPDSNGSGVHHAVISLYGALLDLMRPKFEERADAYATAIWSTGTNANGQSYTGDVAYFAEHDSIADFLDRLFKTKVDIDPITHKIISSQLPDYILGAPKYMGRFSADEAARTTLGASTTATAFAKWLLDNDTGSWASSEDWENLDISEDDTSGDGTGDNVTGSKTVNDKLKAGCYWIYEGDTWDVGNFSNLFNLYDADDYQDGDVEEGTDPDATVQHLLNKGDWIVYNGELQKFDIIDNTSSFIGILVHGSKISGVAEFKDKVRTATSTVERYIDGTKQSAESFKVNETQIAASDGKTIEFKNPASVLFKTQLSGSEETALTSSNFIPVISGEGWAYNSRFELIHDETGLKVSWGGTGPVSDVSFTFFKENDEDATDYLFKDTEFKASAETFRSVETVRIKTDATDGFDFLDFNFAPDVDIYKYTMELVKSPDLYLPQYSGVLTTESYVDQGFTVIKAIIEDLYDTLIDETSKGHVEWLQTVRYKTNDKGERVKNDKGEDIKEIYDSKVLEEYKAGEKLLLKLFFDNDKTETSYDENASDSYSILSTYKSLTNTLLFEEGLKAGEGPLDYQLGAEDGAAVEVLNPSTAQTGVKPENILPNHSGILLNNNSVIDGGEWL